MAKVTESHEDYLEAIVMLGGTDESSVRPVDVASKMGVSKASVNKAVTVLKEGGFLDQPYYGDITLTADGYAYGLKVLERHTTLSLFLTRALGIDEKTADAEACLIEHDISDESFRKWIAYIKGLHLQ
jgi:DtxR family Mn-dependent transcriptional regulator